MKTKHTRWLITIALIAALGTAPAAQDQPDEFESWRGPGWTFVPGMTFGTIYDSNIGVATPPADTQRTDSDRLMLAAPFGTLEYVGKRTEFATGYRGYFLRYADFEELNSFDQRLHASFRHLASKYVTVYLQNSYMDVPTTDEIELNGVPFTRSGAQSNSFAAGVDTRLTRYTDLKIRYDHTWVDFDRKENFLTGGLVNGVRGELSRRLSERASLGAEYAFRFADLNEGTREFTFHDVGGTARYALTAHTSLSGGGGMSRLTDRLTGETRNGPYFRVGITRDGERSTIGASFDRQFVPSFGFGGSNQSQELRGFIHMPLSRNRVYVQGTAAWRRSDPFLENEVELDSVWLRSTVGYAVARWFRTEFYYAYTRQDSVVTGGEIDRHRVGVQFVVAQPMRIR